MPKEFEEWLASRPEVLLTSEKKLMYLAWQAARKCVFCEEKIVVPVCERCRE
jgi:hypothetical protein